MRVRWATWQLAVRALCAIALAFLALAQQPQKLIAPDQSEIEISQFVLPDGTLPLLCVTDQHGSGPSHDYGKPLCGACLITAATLLPAPAASVGEPLPQVLAVLLPPRIEAAYRQIFPPSSPTRGPPARLIA